MSADATMPLPTFDCPVCRTPLTWDVIFAHVGVRDAMKALVNAHPDGALLLRPLLAYVTLWAPAKTAMRYERIAAVVNELVAMTRAAQIERNGRTWPAPLDYWRQAFDEVVGRAHAGTLRVPLTSHGYLLEVIAGYSNRAEAQAETARESQRAGHTGAGTTLERAQGTQEGPIAVNAALARSEMPAHVREQLQELTTRRQRRAPSQD